MRKGTRLKKFISKVDYIKENHPDIYKEMREKPVSSDEFKKIWDKIKGEKK